jgi:hypothetical protein
MEREGRGGSTNIYWYIIFDLIAMLLSLEHPNHADMNQNVLAWFASTYWFIFNMNQYVSANHANTCWFIFAWFRCTKHSSLAIRSNIIYQYIFVLPPHPSLSISSKVLENFWWNAKRRTCSKYK